MHSFATPQSQPYPVQCTGPVYSVSKTRSKKLKKQATPSLTPQPPISIMRHNRPLSLGHNQQIDLRCHITNSIHPIQAGPLVLISLNESRLIHLHTQLPDKPDIRHHLSGQHHSIHYNLQPLPLGLILQHRLLNLCSALYLQQGCRSQYLAPSNALHLF